MTKVVNRELERLFKGENAKQYFAMDESIASQARILVNKLQSKFTQLFGTRSKSLAEMVIAQSDRSSAVVLKESLAKLAGGVTLKTDIFTSKLNEIVTASVTENVKLIKSIPENYFNQVNGSVMRSITTGQGLKDLIPDLQKYSGMTERRAKNIATDQTRKIYNSVNKSRMQAVGIAKFEWVHSGGGQYPREDHIEMSGNIYSFDDLPVIDKKTGERGIPGQAINCRCTMVPVIEFNDGEPEIT